MKKEAKVGAVLKQDLSLKTGQEFGKPWHEDFFGIARGIFLSVCPSVRVSGFFRIVVFRAPLEILHTYPAARWGRRRARTSLWRGSCACTRVMATTGTR